MISIDDKKCIGCSLCEKKCIFGAIKMSNNLPVINNACVYCGTCASVCPQKAIYMETLSGDSVDFSRYSNVWAIMEIDEQTQKPKKVSYELVSQAKKLANALEQKAVAVCLCAKESVDMRERLESIGCDELILVENDELSEYDTDIYTDIISGLIIKGSPNAILFPATPDGRDLAPRISGRLKVGLTADCTDLELNSEKQLVQIRPTYGGNVMAWIISPNSRPQMASVRPNVFKITHSSKASKLKVSTTEIKIGKNRRIKSIGFKPKDIVYKDVSEAGIILSGGYGLGQDGFPLLHKLAIKIGAAVGATRKPVDEGWAPYDIQIGQTGKTVAPDLYIACGISGALQHSIGIQHSKRIIAINNDPIAPIFSQSDVSILGDVKQVLANLIDLVDQKGSTVLDDLK
jgi:electron transfer flavoprotein alpha subunit